MLAKMLDVGRGERCINNLKNSPKLKSLAFWKNETPFIDKKMLYCMSGSRITAMLKLMCMSQKIKHIAEFYEDD